MRFGISLFQYLSGKIGGTEELIVQLVRGAPEFLSIDDQLYLIGGKNNLQPFRDISDHRILFHQTEISQWMVKFLRLVDIVRPDVFSSLVAKSIHSLNLDVLLFPQQSIFPHGTKAKKVVIVVDVAHLRLPRNFSGIDRMIRKRKEKYLFRKADGIIAISKMTQQDIQRWYHVPAHKSKVIYLGGDTGGMHLSHPFEFMKEPYVLYPANSYPHKNHYRLIRSFLRFKNCYPESTARLILTGGILNRGLRTILLDPVVKKHVLHLGYLKKAKLNTVIEGCEAIFFPSVFEGFGIPVIEGIRFGKPVFCSSLPVFKEIVGDAVEYFEPRDIDDMVRQFEKIFILRHLSVDHAKYEAIISKINWKNWVKETIRYIRQISNEAS